jgi:hypothetical protein
MKKCKGIIIIVAAIFLCVAAVFLKNNNQKKGMQQTDALTPTGFASGEIQRLELMYDGQIYYYFDTGFKEQLPEECYYVGSIKVVNNYEEPSQDFDAARLDVGQIIYKLDSGDILYVQYDSGYAKFSKEPLTEDKQTGGETNKQTAYFLNKGSMAEDDRYIYTMRHDTYLVRINKETWEEEYMCATEDCGHGKVSTCGAWIGYEHLANCFNVWLYEGDLYFLSQKEMSDDSTEMTYLLEKMNVSNFERSSVTEIKTISQCSPYFANGGLYYFSKDNLGVNPACMSEYRLSWGRTIPAIQLINPDDIYGRRIESHKSNNGGWYVYYLVDDVLYQFGVDKKGVALSFVLAENVYDYAVSGDDVYFSRYGSGVYKFNFKTGEEKLIYNDYPVTHDDFAVFVTQDYLVLYCSATGMMISLDYDGNRINQSNIGFPGTIYIMDVIEDELLVNVKDVGCVYRVEIPSLKTETVITEEQTEENPINTDKEIVYYLMYCFDEKLKKDVIAMQKELELSDDEIEAIREIGLKQYLQNKEADKQFRQDGDVEKSNETCHLNAVQAREELQQVLGDKYDTFLKWIAIWWEEEKEYRIGTNGVK